MFTCNTKLIIDSFGLSFDSCTFNNHFPILFTNIKLQEMIIVILGIINIFTLGNYVMLCFYKYLSMIGFLPINRISEKKNVFNFCQSIFYPTKQR